MTELVIPDDTVSGHTKGAHVYNGESSVTSATPGGEPGVDKVSAAKAAAAKTSTGKAGRGKTAAAKARTGKTAGQAVDQNPQAPAPAPAAAQPQPPPIFRAPAAPVEDVVKPVVTPPDAGQTHVFLAVTDEPTADVADEPTEVVKPVVATVKPVVTAAKPGADDNTLTVLGVPAAPKPSATKDPPPVPRPRPRRGFNRHNPLMWLLVGALVLVLAGVIGLLVAVKHFEGKAKIGTSVAGEDVAGQTVDQVRATVQRLGSGMQLTTELGGKTVQFDMGKLGVTLDAQKTVDQVMAASAGWWPMHVANVPLALNFNPDKMQQALDDAFVVAADRPKDAAVSLEVTTDAGSSSFSNVKFAVTPSVQGKTVDTAPVTAALTAMAGGRKPSTVPLSTLTIDPPITTDKASSAADKADQMSKGQFKFTSGNKSYSLQQAEVAPWLTFTPNDAAGQIAVGVDQAAVAAGLPGILNAEVATPPVNQQVLYSPEGQQIAVDSPGKDGTQVANPDKIVQALVTALSSQQPLSMNVSTVTKAFGTDKVPVGGAYDQPNGSKWIEINQTTFQVIMWEGTTKIHQFTCVTGAPKTPTIDGTFYVYIKYASKDMRGTNADGSTWFAGGVQWVCFFIRGFAIHAAPWRATFGYRASHGCVNLSTANAKIVYDWAPVGTRVVVHW